MFDPDYDSLQRDVRRFVDLLQACSNGVAICKSNRIVPASPAFVRLLSVKGNDELIGKDFSSIFSVATRAGTARKLDEILVAGLGHQATCSAELLRDDGSVVAVDASIDHLELNGECDRVVMHHVIVAV